MAASFSVNTEGTLTSASVSPFTVAPDLWPLWGAQISASYDSDATILTLGVSYRLDWPRFLAAELVSSTDRDDAIAALREAGRYALQLASFRATARGAWENVADYCGALGPIHGLAEGVRRDLPDQYTAPHLVAARDIALASASLLDAAVAAQQLTYACATRPTGAVTQADRDALVELAETVEADLRRLHVLDPGGSDPTGDGYEDVRRAVVRASFGRIPSLLPAITLGYRAGIYPAVLDQSRVSGTPRPWRADESHRFIAQLYWHYGPFVEFQAEAAYGMRRFSSTDDPTTAMVNEAADASYVSVSSTAIVVLPWLLGAEPYDDYFFTELFQRGIGLGVTFSYEACLAAEMARSACRKSRLSRLSVGGVVDLRIATSARLRIQLGYLDVRTFDATMVMGQTEGVETVATFAYSLE